MSFHGHVWILFVLLLSVVISSNLLYLEVNWFTANPTPTPCSPTIVLIGWSIKVHNRLWSTKFAQKYFYPFTPLLNNICYYRSKLLWIWFVLTEQLQTIKSSELSPNCKEHLLNKSQQALGFIGTHVLFSPLSIQKQSEYVSLVPGALHLPIFLSDGMIASASS